MQNVELETRFVNQTNLPARISKRQKRFKVMDMLFNHPLTDKGLEQFLKDYNKVFAETPAAR